MKLYRENRTTIFSSQANDPLINHLFRKVIKHLPGGKGKKILDIGCGVGRLAALVAVRGYEVEGIEINEAPLRIAKEKFGSLKSIMFIHDDFIEHEFDENSFDIVVCTEVIEHVLHPKTVVNKIGRVLKKGGLCILSTPHNQKYWTILDRYAEHKKRFSEDEIRRLFKDFKIIELFTVGFPSMFFIMQAYGRLAGILKIRHSVSWRSGLFNSVYALIAGWGLKFDDIFNKFKLGTNFFIVAVKPTD